MGYKGGDGESELCCGVCGRNITKMYKWVTFMHIYVGCVYSRVSC